MMGFFSFALGVDLGKQVVNEGALSLLEVLLGLFERFLHFFNSREVRGCGVEWEGLFRKWGCIITKAL